MTCTEMLMIVDWDCSVICVPIFTVYESCDVTASYPEPEPVPAPSPPPSEPPPPPPGGSPYLPTVNIAQVDTTDPGTPVLAADVSIDPTAGGVTVTCYVNGANVGSSSGGSARYQFNLPAIAGFGDGTAQLTVQACDSYGACGSGSAQMTRSTQNPLEADATLVASWYEPDYSEPIPVPAYMQATFSHVWRQFYTDTWFSVSEVGENSRRQVRDFTITLSAVGKVFDPLWNGAVVSGSQHNGDDCANPLYCAQACWTKCGSGWEFGYLPTLSESVFAVSIDGYSCGVNGADQSLTLQ